jgi:hypothetical protein
VAAQAAGGELGGGWRLPSRLIASDVHPVETLSEMRLVVSDGLVAQRARVIAQCFGVGRGALPAPLSRTSRSAVDVARVQR